jgi:hypothetical protein
VDEESNDEEQVLNVHVHHKEVSKEPESDEPTSETPDSEQPDPPKTFEPQPIGPEFTPAPTKKRKIKKWIIIIAVVILVIAIAAGAGAYYLINNKTTTVKKTSNSLSSSKTTTKTTVSSLKPTTVVTAVQEYIKTKYPQVMPEGTKLAAEQIYFKSSDIAPNWKISGEKFYVSYTGNGASGLAVYYNWESGSNDAISARYVGISNAIIQSLTTQGFTKSTDSVYGTNQYNNIAYVKGDVVCVTNSPDSGTISPPSSFACGQISKYTKNMDSYKEIEPYAQAYEKAGKMQNGDVFSFSELKVGMSGYKNANVGLSNVGALVGGAMGLFYKSQTGDWQFFTGTQAEIDCTAYNTKDLQYAFAYDTCGDSSKTGDAANTTIAGFYNLQP